MNPTTWVLLDDRPGNHTQSLGLADALGWPYQTVELRFGPLSALHPALRDATRVGLDRARSDALQPPWPDLVIAAGGRPANIGRWIRKQSGGRTRLVALGRRAGAAACHFDLAATPHNARLWAHPNRVETLLPLNRIRDDALTKAAEHWKPTFEASPAPRIALLVGGASALYRFDVGDAQRLGELTAKLATERAGSVFVTTSRRTGSPQADALHAALRDTIAHFHRWTDPTEDNPFLAYLALADLLVVTGESESMLAEVCATTRPVLIYPLPPKPASTKRRLGEKLMQLAEPEREKPTPGWGAGGITARLIASGLLLPPRNLEALHQDLIASGRASDFASPTTDTEAAPIREVDEIASRVGAWFGGQP